MVPHVILLVCKDSAKFRFSEGNENKFSFLSVRKLTKLSEIQRKNDFFSIIVAFRREIFQIYSKSYTIIINPCFIAVPF